MLSAVKQRNLNLKYLGRQSVFHTIFSTNMDWDDGISLPRFKDQSDYHEWVDQMEIVFQSKDIYTVITGERSKPSDTSEEDIGRDWAQANALCSILLRQALNDDQRQYVSSLKTPQERWK